MVIKYTRCSVGEHEHATSLAHFYSVKSFYQKEKKKELTECIRQALYLYAFATLHALSIAMTNGYDSKLIN